jgi:2-oxoglutarate ferredoxin oxidoreductase subunit gamma
MIEKIIVAGSGGQGIMLLGKIAAQAAMYSALRTTWLPAYGAEVRGGAAYCMVTLSDEPIGNPYIEQADVFLALNETGFLKFRHRIKPGALWILNDSLVSSRPAAAPDVIAGSFTDKALLLGNVRVANIIALGAYVAARGTLEADVVKRVMREYGSSVPKPLVELNLKALQTGIALARQSSART